MMMKTLKLGMALLCAPLFFSCQDAAQKRTDEISKAVEEYAQRNLKDPNLEIETVLLKDTVSNLRIAQNAQRELEALTHTSDAWTDSLSSAYVNLIGMKQLAIVRSWAPEKSAYILEPLQQLYEEIHAESSDPVRIQQIQEFSIDYGSLCDAIAALQAKYKGEVPQVRYQIIAKNGGETIKLSAFQNKETQKVTVSREEFSSQDFSKEARQIEASLPKVEAYYTQKDATNQRLLKQVAQIRAALQAVK